MKDNTRILMLSGLVALASVAGGQVQAGGTAQSSPVLPPAPSPQPPALPPAPPAIPPGPPSVVPAQPVTQPAPISAGTAAGASSGAAGSVNSPVNRPDLGASTNVGGQVDTRATTEPGRVDVGAGGRTSVDSRVNGAGVGSMVTGESSISLRTDDTVRAIQSTAFATRDQVTTDVQARIDATSGLLDELRSRADAAGDQSKTAFARAVSEVRQREREVRASLRAAARATADSWGEVQSELAQNYSAYARAVAEAEVAARTR